MIKKMDKVVIFGVMEKNMKDNFKMTSEMEKEFINGQMETGFQL